MHVDVGVELPGDVEDNLDMPPAVLRRRFIERHAADDINTEFHDLAHQRFGTGRFDDALLRKGHDLDIDQITKSLARTDQTFGRACAADRIDIDMGAQPRDTVLQGLREDARRPVRDFVHRVTAFELPQDLDGFVERPGAIDGGAFRDQRFVQMNMRLDEAGNGHSALGVER